MKAGIERADSLVSTLPKDTDNVFVVLTARQLCKNLRIFSRCNAVSTESKLRSAGANNIILPDQVSGARMAGFVINHNINSFLDKLAIFDNKNEYLLEKQVKDLPEDLQNQSVSKIHSALNTPCHIIGIKKADGNFIVNPGNDVTVSESCHLFFLGSPDEIKALKEK